jgi:hypothetical protein
LVHNAFALYRQSQNVKQLIHLDFWLQIIKELSEVHGKALEPPCIRRPSKIPTSDSKTLCRKDTSLWEEGQAQAKVSNCLQEKWGKKETSFWHKDHGVGLCLEECFKMYHTKVTF